MLTLQTFQEKAVVWLRQGISPRRLAFTLSLGFVVGCIPIVGLPTGLCAVIALAFGLNQPAIQAANYLAMPIQVALIVPLVRLGAKLMPVATHPGIPLATLPQSPFQAVAHTPQLILRMGGIAGQALFAWLLLAIPVVVVLTPVLTAILRRVPAVAAAELAD